MKRAVKFNANQQPEFIIELRQKVRAHFADTKESTYANWNMVLKTVFMLSLYLVPLGYIIFLEGSLFTQLLMWSLMGLGTAGIGMSVMHDANHGAYSKHAAVNTAVGWLVNLLGGYHINWIIQHNVLHHSYTNIHGHDEDIEQKIMRFSPDQERKSQFKHQAYYAPFLYGLMTIFWVFYKDFDQLIRYQKRGLLKAQGLSFAKAWIQLIIGKLVYVTLIVVLPLAVGGLNPWHWLIGFLTMHFIAGLILALIFQPAHVLEETSFYEAADGSVENSWAIHQMRTTANFANESRWFTWLVGGLNFQIEHHLFPHICHVHYRKISTIVKETASKHNVPYHEHRTFGKALKSHFNLLSTLGSGS